MVRETTGLPPNGSRWGAAVSYFVGLNHPVLKAKGAPVCLYYYYSGGFFIGIRAKKQITPLICVPSGHEDMFGEWFAYTGVQVK